MHVTDLADRARAAVEAGNAYLNRPADLTFDLHWKLRTAAERTLNDLAAALRDPVDVYPVGLFADLKRLRNDLAIRHPAAWRRFRLALALEGNRLRGRRWRAAWNYFNGYLAEHQRLGTRCGHGWTRRRARRSLARHLAQLDRARAGR